MNRQKAASERKRGGVLVEFAVVALIFYLFFSAVVDMGRASFMVSAANDAARLLARELALEPLPSAFTFEGALNSDRVKGELVGGEGVGIYSDRFLAIDLDDQLGGMSLDQYFDTLPIVNRALRPLMFFDTIEVDGADRSFFRYPGTVVRLENQVGPRYTVVVPVLDYLEEGGVEIVEWRPVVEEIRGVPPGPSNPVDSPFHVDSPEGGIAAIRINVPFQSSATAARRIDSSDPNSLFDQSFKDLVLASVGEAPSVDSILPQGSSILQSSSGQETGAYAGEYGLGQLRVLGEEVRPFRKILSAQSIFRREVFAD